MVVNLWPHCCRHEWILALWLPVGDSLGRLGAGGGDTLCESVVASREVSGADLLDDFVVENGTVSVAEDPSSVVKVSS